MMRTWWVNIFCCNFSCIIAVYYMLTFCIVVNISSSCSRRIVDVSGDGKYFRRRWRVGSGWTGFYDHYRWRRDFDVRRRGAEQRFALQCLRGIRIFKLVWEVETYFFYVKCSLLLQKCLFELFKKTSRLGHSSSYQPLGASPKSNNHLLIDAEPPPELEPETLMDSEHRQVLAKLRFVLELIEALINVAENKTNPIAMMMEGGSRKLVS